MRVAAAVVVVHKAAVAGCLCPGLLEPVEGRVARVGREGLRKEGSGEEVMQDTCKRRCEWAAPPQMRVQVTAPTLNRRVTEGNMYGINLNAEGNMYRPKLKPEDSM